ncbi:MAG: hypothetical protein K9J45_02230 [Bacteroidales bacterium]|nr:hypothetical protein [Bacteroidales bacterium]
MLLAAYPAASQEIPQLLFDNYSTADGLSSNEVHATLRDKKGFLWLATGNGLNRFDGYYFKVFLNVPGDSTSIGDNVVFALAEDSKGLLWVGTGNGLYRYDPLTERFEGSFLPKTVDSSAFDVKRMFIDSEDCLWMGSSFPVGLLKFDTGHRQFERFVNPIAEKKGEGNLVNVFYEDKKGLLWVGTHCGLFTFDPASNRFESILQLSFGNDKNRNFIITSILPDRYRVHLLWLTTWGDGLWKYDKSTGKSERFLLEPQFRHDGVHNVFHDLLQTDSTHLYLGGTGLTLFDIKNQKFSLPQSSHEATLLKTGEVSDFQQDAEGNIWIAGPVGFARLSLLRQQFGAKKIPFPLAVYATLIDTPSQKNYFGTAYYNRSLVIYDALTGQWETRRMPLLDEKHAGVLKILKDKWGFLWFITAKGLFRYDLQKNRLEPKAVIFKNGESSTAHICPQAEQDTEGNLFFRFDNTANVEYLQAADSLVLPDFEADALGKVKDGSLLLASKKGVTRLVANGSEVRFFPFPIPGMADVSPCAIAADFIGQYWIGTQNNGIFIFRPGETGQPAFRKLSLEDGLPSNCVHQLACDPDGNIWAGTRQGLVKIDPSNLGLTVFTQADGLLTDNFFIEPTFLPSGEAFVTLGGSPLYHHFDFRKVGQPDLDSLPFYFHNFRISGKPVVFEKDINYLPGIALAYPANAFSVEFAALTMEGQKSIRYAYRLAGLEGHWTDADAHRFAAYTNLSPGDYRLEVRMSNRRGSWSENIHSLQVTVLPAWWQRAWVQVLAGLLLLGLVSFAVARFVNQRLHQRITALERQRELEAIRRRIAQDIHDEAGAGLTKIGLTAQVAVHLPPSDGIETKKRFEAILAETRLVSARLAEVLFAVNPRYDHFEAVQAWLREWGRRFLEDAGMEAGFDLPKSKYDPVVPPEVKRNLLLICKEALNNAVKYSGSDRVLISFSLDEDGRGYLLRVQDFGRGFSQEEVGVLCNGLAGMKGRAAEIGAEFSVESWAGKGTTVKVRGRL